MNSAAYKPQKIAKHASRGSVHKYDYNDRVPNKNDNVTIKLQRKQ